MDVNPPCPGQGSYRPVEFLLVQLGGGGFQAGLLAGQPVPGRKAAGALQGTGQLHRRSRGGLLQHQGFQGFEVPATRVAGKAGEGGLGKAQTLGQLPDGQKQKGVGIGVDEIQNGAFRPGQLFRRNGKAQFHGIESPFLVKMKYTERAAAKKAAGCIIPPAGGACPEKGA